ncbi:unnamed protein product, partial [Adineta steineri]
MEVILKFKTPLRPAVDNVTPLITCIPQPPEQMSADGGEFSSSISVSIEIFDPLTGLAIGPLQTLGTLISGGTFKLTVSASGSVGTGGT